MGEDREIQGLPGTGGMSLSRVQFERLNAVPDLFEWLANIENRNTRRAYRQDLADFMRFVGLTDPHSFPTVSRPHVIAWRKDLERRALKPASIRRKLAALSELFDFLCEQNAVDRNSVNGVKRPRQGANEGKTPALSDAQARRLLDAPDPRTLKGKRDRAILATLLFHALRRAELCLLTVGDYQLRRGVPSLMVQGKGGKIRYLPVHPEAAQRIETYLDMAGHRADELGALFRPVRNSVGGLDKAICPASIYQDMLKRYAQDAKIPEGMLRPHVLRATAATNALENGADITRVQEWLGHASITTTRLYDKRRSKPEESPSFKVRY
jgi:integrase/recombinase XerD